MEYSTEDHSLRYDSEEVMNINDTNFVDVTRRRFCMWAGASLLSVVIGRPRVAIAQQADRSADLDALVKDAQAEGDLTYYLSLTENVAKQISQAFTKKYGIKTQYLRLLGPVVQQRLAAEAQSGAVVADLAITAGNIVAFADEAIKNGWISKPGNAGLPVLESGQFPARFRHDNFIVVSIAPWDMCYNSSKVEEVDLPKEWTDILKPKFKGQIMLTDPVAAESYLDFWAALHDRFGDDFFARLRAQKPRVFSSGVQAVQALAAGEGWFLIPTVKAQVDAMVEKGAPLASLRFDYTAGVEGSLTISALDKVKHPSAARLFANYIMSREGNGVLTTDAGALSVYDAAQLPKEYVPSNPKVVERKGELRKLLGLN
jgi:iron(III) transport system substrate-binding protein